MLIKIILWTIIALISFILIIFDFGVFLGIVAVLIYAELRLWKGLNTSKSNNRQESYEH